MRGFRLCAELGEKGKPDARKAMESFPLALRESEQQDVYAASPPPACPRIYSLQPCPFFIQGCTATQNRTQTNRKSESLQPHLR